MKKYGFTLAEVLITLMIIGIVAALTIPSVISNYQQQEFKTGLKKAVSVLNEAIQTNIAQDGETPYENADLFSYFQRHMSVLNTGKYLSCLKWGEKDESDKCMKDAGNIVLYTTDGMRFEFSNDDRGPSFELHESDAVTGGEPILTSSVCTQTQYSTSCSYKYSHAFCGAYGLSSNPNNTKYTPCIVTVDVNGDKKPNSVNIDDKESFQNPHTFPMPSDKKLSDIFSIMITDEKAIPFGVVAQRAMYSK